MRKCGKRLSGLNLIKSSGSYRSAEIELLGDDLCREAIQLRIETMFAPMLPHATPRHQRRLS
jgi:hypothetical protein